eukprot:GHVS01026214.1.p2 GENE.GHVS01026214.1~~GHVS01026214.1.p2  ORF type:complete len:127 (-),score=9.86 GHVS01026214.1:178-558(-)
MKDNKEPNVEKLFPDDVIMEGFGHSDENKYWRSVLGFSDMFAGSPNVLRDDLCVDRNKTFANRFSVEYSAIGNIFIESPGNDHPYYTIRRSFTAVVVTSIGNREVITIPETFIFYGSHWPRVFSST